MSTTTTNEHEEGQHPQGTEQAAAHDFHYYRIRFRKSGQQYTAKSVIAELDHDDLVMVKTEHGPEPAVIAGRTANMAEAGLEGAFVLEVLRRITAEEIEKYEQLPGLEQEAFTICKERIASLALPMHLVRVERFYNGSKIIFYFTAEARIDFRELVKDLVQMFRTRVEMRQIGVRHETQMTGGIGPCGRELCCTTFLSKFESVSIKMAKTQDLPLNPAKISGLCNRLLCCLTYEFDSYREMKKGMPRIGKWIEIEDKSYRVARHMALQGSVTVISKEGEEMTLSEEQWRELGQGPKAAPPKQPPKKK